MNFTEVIDTPLLNDVIVKEYSNGILQKKYASSRVNFGGIFFKLSYSAC